MRNSEDMWDVERAKAWLRGYPWGGPFVAQLTASADAEGTARWVRMVMRMYTARCNSAAAATGASDGEEVEPEDLAGWPALVAHLHD